MGIGWVVVARAKAAANRHFGQASISALTPRQAADPRSQARGLGLDLVWRAFDAGSAGVPTAANLPRSPRGKDYRCEPLFTHTVPTSPQLREYCAGRADPDAGFAEVPTTAKYCARRADPDSSCEILRKARLPVRSAFDAGAAEVPTAAKILRRASRSSLQGARTLIAIHF